MNILVTNNSLTHPAGTENYTFAIINSLLKKGHYVEYYTCKNGQIGKIIETKLGVKPKRQTKYDLILANHTSTIEKINGCGYIIQTCHGVFPYLEQPDKRANKHVAITYEVQEHIKQKGFDSSIILNGIDCERFYPKKELNNTLKTVLSLCQSPQANKFIQDCCKKMNIKYLQAYKYTDKIWDIENKINEADLVVGIGRSAYDAMACGRCVVSFDMRSYSGNYGDGYINKDNINNSILYNMSGRFSKQTYNEKKFIEELKKYNPEDGFFLRDFALTNLNIDTQIDKYINLYNLSLF